MRKTAAIRSQARRAALTKAAAPAPQVPGQLVEDYIRRVDPNYTLRGLGVYERMVDPANVGATAGIAGGAGLLGSALFNKDQSTGARIAKGIAGAGLAGGGTILAMSDKARNATRKFVLGMLGRAAEPFRTKYAEAMPTPEEQAFAAGFCKAAEAMGVDPGALYKEAALSRRGALRWVMSLGKVTPRTKAPQITGIIDRLQGVGRLPSPVAENLSHMRNLATAVDKYTAARGATTNWLGMPTFPEATLAKGRKFIPQLIEDASRLNGGGAMSAGEIDVSSAAKNILKMIGYMK